MNSNARKNIIYSLVIFLLVLAVYLYRSQFGSSLRDGQPKSTLVNFKGEFFEQPYLILYHSTISIEKGAVDSILNKLTVDFSSGNPNSLLSKINLSDTLLNPSKELVNLLRFLKNESEKSKGTWDPTLDPLTTIWGFTSSGPILQDSIHVSDVLANVGLGKILVTDSLIRKIKRGITLDLTDFGQAQALDELAAFLDRKGIYDYFLQIGRHALAKGLNEKKELWKIKTAYPQDSTGIKKEGLIALENKAISTSGDFSSFYMQDSLRKPFQLDPRTGYPVNHGLLGVRVLAKNSKTAAIASQSLMVQGFTEGLRLDSARTDLEMILIFNKKGKGVQIYSSPELRSYLSFKVN